MILDMLFPKFCIGCNTFGSYICTNCIGKIYLVNKDVCPYCEKISLYGRKHDTCIGEVDGVISLFHYKGFIRTFIKTVKYKLLYSVWEDFYTFIPEYRLVIIKEIIKISPSVAFQVIPLHTRRLKERGFNQVTPFAKFLKVKTGINTVDILKRARYTTPQATSTGREDRQQNMRDAFVLKVNKIEYNTIILIDDVYTTGSTCKEAAKVLKQQGVNTVYAITLARG